MFNWFSCISPSVFGVPFARRQRWCLYLSILIDPSLGFLDGLCLAFLLLVELAHRYESIGDILGPVAIEHGGLLSLHDNSSLRGERAILN